AGRGRGGSDSRPDPDRRAPEGSRYRAAHRRVAVRARRIGAVGPGRRAGGLARAGVRRRGRAAVAGARTDRAARGRQRRGGVAGGAQRARLESRYHRDRSPARRHGSPDRGDLPEVDRGRRGPRRNCRPADRWECGAAARPAVRPAQLGHGGGWRAATARLGAARGDTRDRRRTGHADRADYRARSAEANAMIRRILSLIVITWAFGSLCFAMTLPRPGDGQRTDAIVVPTGSGGRIPRGLEMLEKGLAP